MDDFGNVVGQIAHIKGVKPTSARYDPKMPADKKREPENLLLLCYAHHIETNSEEKFPTARMREIKEAHEQRFGGVISGLRTTLADKTDASMVRFPSNWRRYKRSNGLSEEDIQETKRNYLAWMERLRRLPPNVRSVLSTVVERGKWESDGYELLFAEAVEVLHVDSSVLGQLIDVLQFHGLKVWTSSNVKAGARAACY